MKCFDKNGDEMGEHQIKYRPQDIKTKTFVFWVNVYNKENIRKFDSKEEADEVADNWSGRLGPAERIEITREIV